MGHSIDNQIKFIDTNIFLTHLDQIREEEFFLISSITISELEEIKSSKNKSDEIKHAARIATRFLDKNPNKYEVIVYSHWDKFNLKTYELEDTPDNRIIICVVYAKENLGYSNLTFLSNDILVRLIAKRYCGIDSHGLDSEIEEIYRGYQEYSFNSNELNYYLNNFEKSEWNVNEYLIIHNTDDGTTKEMRFDGDKFVGLKLPPSKYIKAKNSLQRCALDILMNPNITIAAILGGYGSGKSYLATNMALFHVIEKGNQSKILGIREPHGEGRAVGYLPGSLAEKTDSFFLPIAQQLNGGEFELEHLKTSGVIEVNIPYYLKGTTYNNRVFLVDEPEDLTKKQLRLIGTRLGENSKIFLAGDYKQSVVDMSENNALVQMCNELKGNSKFGCVYLGEDVRSETSKLFAELFSK